MTKTQAPWYECLIQLRLLGAFITRRSWMLILTLLILTVVAKNGLRYSAWEGSLDEALEAFPQAVNYNSSALFAMLIASGVPKDQRSSSLLTLWPQLLTLVVILAATIRRVRFCSHDHVKARVIAALVAVAMSPFVSLLLGNIGFGRDWIPVLGLSLMVLSRSLWGSVLGVLIAVFANPEQTLVAVLMLITAVYFGPLVAWRRRVSICGIVALCFALPILAWQSLSGRESRLTYLLSNGDVTVSAFAIDPATAVYAALSASWAIVILWTLIRRPLGGVLAVWASLGIGLIFMALTADGTRVFSIIVAPLLIILILDLTVPRQNDMAELRTSNYSIELAVIVLLSVTLPAVTWAGTGGIPATSAAASIANTIERMTSEIHPSQ